MGKYANPIVEDSPRQVVSWDGSQYRIHAGYRPELIAAGLIKPGQFPGDPGQRKTASRFVNADGRKCRATTSGMIIRVHVYYTPEEQLAYDIRTKKAIARMVDEQATWAEGARETFMHEISELESRVARSDHGFQAFMQRAVSDPDEDQA
ncbi:MAG: hypothetical protein WC830_10120 [Burkholderiales bacterium]|jgi:hypothetical protein